MGNKLLIVTLCMLCGVMSGLFFSRRLAKRAEYFSMLVLLVNVIISEVKFKKSTTKTILREFIQTNSSPLNEHINEYILCEDIKNLTLTRQFLTKGELATVMRLFSSFGTLDSQTQIFELENYKEKLSIWANESQQKKKMYSAMYIKLGFFVGLALGIILL